MRLAGQAVAGYFPTPVHLVPRIARLLAVDWTATKERGYAPEYSVLDPCAGDGAAVLDLVAELVRPAGDDARAHLQQVALYAVEMERDRHTALLRNAEAALPWRARRETNLAHADAFTVDFDPGAAALLFLNPPYDHDVAARRAEERFLRRFGPALAPGGVLVFLVPHHALEASADTLAREFTDVACWRFPPEDFEVFKQVVLVARRHASLRQPDPALVARVRAWSEDAASMPVLPARPAPVASLPDHPEYPEPLDGWEVAPMDLTGLLAEVQPWTASDRGGRAQPIPGVTPPADGSDLLARSYPTAMPPRAAHVASAIAAGVFNGARLEPDASSSPLPPVLVKGTFDREFRTVEEKTNKDGAITGLVQVQQPKLSVTALDLRTKRYHTLRNSTDLSSAQPSGSSPRRT
jgi:SAM-dependent methyltransferase